MKYPLMKSVHCPWPDEPDWLTLTSLCGYFLIPMSNENNLIYSHHSNTRGADKKYSFYSSWITLDFIF